MLQEWSLCSHSPLGLPKVSPAWLSKPVFWERVFLAGHPDAGLKPLVPQEEALLLELSSCLQVTPTPPHPRDMGLDYRILAHPTCLTVVPSLYL